MNRLIILNDILYSEDLFNKCINVYGINEPDDIYGWFENDLLGFFNNNQALMYGFNDVFKKFVKRHHSYQFNMNTYNKLYKLLTKLYGHETDNELRKKCKILWSLLHINEKHAFYDSIKTTYR